MIKHFDHSLLLKKVFDHSYMPRSNIPQSDYNKSPANCRTKLLCLRYLQRNFPGDPAAAIRHWPASPGPPSAESGSGHWRSRACCNRRRRRRRRFEMSRRFCRRSSCRSCSRPGCRGPSRGETLGRRGRCERSTGPSRCRRMRRRRQQKELTLT